MKPELFEVAPSRCNGEGHGGYNYLTVYTGSSHYVYQHDEAFFCLDARRIRDVLVLWACEASIVTYEVEYYDGCKEYALFTPQNDEEVARIAEGRLAKRGGSRE